MTRMYATRLTIPAICLTLAIAGTRGATTTKESAILAQLPVVFEETDTVDGNSAVAYSGGHRFSIEYRTQHLRIAGPGSVLSTRLPGAFNPKFEFEERLPGRSNYIDGNDSRSWRFDVSQFRRVRLRGIYAGIDLVFHGRRGEFEFDFELRAGIDAQKIQMQFDPTEKLEVSTNGELVVGAIGRQWKLRRPVAYQDGPNGRKDVTAAFVRTGRSTVQFRLGNVDPGLPLVIDPVWTFSALIASSQARGQPVRVAVDKSGNIYVVGVTSNSRFPIREGFDTQVTGGRDDVYVMKLNPALAEGEQLIYSTFLGGLGSDQAFAVAVTPTGSIAVGGSTDSLDFPLKNAAQSTLSGDSDGFLTILDPSQSGIAQLVLSTYVGGAGFEIILAVAIGSGGEVFAVGDTNSKDFPVKGAFQSTISGAIDLFIARFDPSRLGAASLVSSSYLGGTGDDFAAGVIHQDGSLFVVGSTLSMDFPVKNAYQPAKSGSRDVFLTQISTTAASDPLVYSTYLGGSGNEFAGGVTVDSRGRAWISGLTESLDFPVTAGAGQFDHGGGADGFLVSLTLAARGFAQLTYGSFLGGPGDEGACCIALDSQGRLHVAAHTSSDNLPVLDAVQSARSGSFDGWVGRYVVTSDGGLVLNRASYWGGSAEDRIVSMALSPDDAPVVAGLTGAFIFPATSTLGPRLVNPSPAFVSRIGDCTVGYREPVASFKSEGGEAKITFNAGPGCAWTASTAAPWVTLGSEKSGTGTGTITLTASRNPSPQPRETAVFVAGSRMTVAQRGSVEIIAPPQISAFLNVIKVRSGPACVQVNTRAMEFSTADAEVIVFYFVTAPIPTDSYSVTFTSEDGKNQFISRNSATIPESQGICALAAMPIKGGLGERVPGKWTVRVDSLYAGSASTSFNIAAPALPVSNKPEIAPGGVGSGADFRNAIAAGSWITIRGKNLASTSRIWSGTDFNGNKLPTALDGVSVTVNGKSAYPYYISPGQINALAPADTSVGPVAVVVTTSSGVSNAVSATLQPVAPAMFLFDPEGRTYVAAVHSDGSLAAKPGLFGDAVITRGAIVGDRLLLYGTGFGPTMSGAPIGEIMAGADPLAASVRLAVFIGTARAQVEFAGLIGPGLYQFNVVVPSVPVGDQELVIEINGVRSVSATRITVAAK